MPQHAHGFESKPRVTERLDDGDYRIEGMKFHMSGAWELRVEISAAAGVDRAVFEIPVAP